MKLGLSSSLQHSSPEEWAKNMEELGCESVVFPVDYQTDTELIERYRTEANKRDLVIAEVGIWKNALAKDKKEAEEAMEYSIGQLRLADEIQAKCCVNVAGSAGPRWDGPYKENFSQKMWDRTVRMIQEVIDEVKPVNTYFTIEPMPWMYPTGPEEYAKLLEDVNRDRFAVHMDAINMINTPDRYFFSEEFLDKCFNILGSEIKSCHIKDVKLLQEYTFQLQECACGQGEFSLEHYVELINKTNPDLPVIIEHLETDEEYISSIEFLKNDLKLV